MSVSYKPWRPLLSGEAAAQFERVLEEIVEALDVHLVDDLDWGRPLLHTYLSMARPLSGHGKRGIELVDRAITALGERDLRPSLYGGFAGVAWLAAHTDLSLHRDPDGIFDEVDDALFALLGVEEPILYDLIGGLVGIGVYFLERLPDPRAVAALAKIVEWFMARAEQTETGTTWLTPPDLLVPWIRELAPNGFYNLGTAHGVPGVIGFLSEVRVANIGIEVDELLRRSTSWLLGQRVDGGFPSWVHVGARPVKARLAWCYGSLGLSLPLLSAARCLGDVQIEKDAINIALECASRRTDTGVTDAGLCHGSAGIGHIFNRLFQSTDQEEFGEAAVFWFERALEMRLNGVGVAGYAPDKSAARVPGHPSEPTSFLTGASGIALAFLAATTTIEPNWDRVLLSSAGSTPRESGIRTELTVPDPTTNQHSPNCSDGLQVGSTPARLQP